MAMSPSPDKLSEQLQQRQESVRHSPQKSVSASGSTFCQHHLGHGRLCLVWTEPPGTPPATFFLCRYLWSLWEDVASTTQLLPLDSIVPGRIFLDTVSRVQCLPWNRICPFLHIMTRPWYLTWVVSLNPFRTSPPASRVQCRQDLQAGVLGRRWGLSFAGCPPGPRLEARPGAARKAGRLYREPPAGSSLSALLARLRGAALRSAALRSCPDRAGAAGCRVSASAACRAGSGGG